MKYGQNEVGREWNIDRMREEENENCTERGRKRMEYWQNEV